MKTYKFILLLVFFSIELTAIVLFLLKEINSLVLTLISITMSMMIALYFMDRYKQIQNKREH